MTFLEKIKAKRAAENGEATAPAVQAANEIVNNATESAEKKKVSPLQGILARKKAAEAAKAAKEAESAAPVEETKETVAEEAPVQQAEAKSEAEPKAEAPAEEKQEEAVKAEEQPAEEAKEKTKAEKVEEEKTEEAPAAEDKAEDAVTEEPKKKRKTTRKKAAKKESASEEETTAAPTMLNAREFEVQNIMDCKMSYEEMVAKFESSLVDEAWGEYKNNVLTELDSIKVASDMNPGMLSVTLTQLDDLDRMITPDHSHFKALLETLTNKEDGICTCIRYQAMANGSNENERRANGYYALTNGTYEGEKINFINLIAGTRMKYIFLDSIKQRIKFMSNLCITFLGALKIENSMDIAINAAAK